MSANFDPEFVECFLEESLDLLSNWESCCLKLEDTIDNDVIAELFRAAHNLKGSSRAVGMDQFGNFVHEIENVITKLKDESLALNPDIIQVLLHGQELLSDWAEKQKENLEQEYIYPEERTEEIKIKLLGVIADEPSENGLSGEGDKGKDEEEFDSEIDLDVLDALLSEGSNDSVVENLFDDNGKSKEGIALKEESIEATNKVEEPPKSLTDTPKLSIKKSDQKSEAKSKASSSKASSETIRVSSNKLEELIQFIGELSIHQSLVAHAEQTKVLRCPPKFTNAIILSTKILKEVQDLAMSLRMLPLKGLFQRLERICKDIARTQKKKIKIVLEGENVSLDKLVIEKITDPLVHIVRNAVDHGIESAEERASLGKSEEAIVTISARQESDSVQVVIAEDGRGLNSEKIKAKAIEKNLINSNDQLTEEEVYKLIFQSGFSTAEQVTDISGRGVGMNVVKESIEKISGTINIESNLGSGTSFLIKLPTSLAILDAFVVEINNEKVVVPLNHVCELIALEDYNLESLGVDGEMIDVRGDVIPVQNLAHYLPNNLNLKTNITSKSALIAKIGSQRIAFKVDRIIGQQQVVVKELNENIAEVPHFSGGTILKDGDPGLILDLEGIGRTYFEGHKIGGISA